MADIVAPALAIVALVLAVLAFWRQLTWRERAVPGYLSEMEMAEHAATWEPETRSLEERIRDARSGQPHQ